MTKEAALRARQAADQAARSNVWSTSLPADFASRARHLYKTSAEVDGGGSCSGLSLRGVTHTPSIEASWLPPWLVAAARSRGFSFDDPKRASFLADKQANVKRGLEVSSAVGAMWRRAMPRSSCWHIHAQCRVVVFDIASAPLDVEEAVDSGRSGAAGGLSGGSSNSRAFGSPAGACYFDTNNKYIPCVCVDDAYRRRGLGSILVVAAVAICESASQNSHWSQPIAFVRGAKPNLTVSPKDIQSQPHLHDFYERLGFRGGRPALGGNYTLTEQGAAKMLEKFTALAVGPTAAGESEPPPS